MRHLNDVTPLEAALAYIDRGWFVFPHVDMRDKFARIAIPGGTDARETLGSNDPNEIKRWYERWGNAGVSIKTGWGRGKSGLSVLSIPDSGLDKLKALEAERGPLPETLTAHDPAGGTHLYFEAQRENFSLLRRIGGGLIATIYGGCFGPPRRQAEASSGSTILRRPGRPAGSPISCTSTRPTPLSSGSDSTGTCTN